MSYFTNPINYALGAALGVGFIPLVNDEDDRHIGTCTWTRNGKSCSREAAHYGDHDYDD
jgi:hypothetical protein